MSELGIEIKSAFTLFGTCSVTYEGRASSKLESGKYLITHKSDGAIFIHGATLATPLNYQPPGSKLYQSGWTLIAISKKEKLEIIIESIEFCHKIIDWSNNKISLIRTERQLCNKLITLLPTIIPNITQITQEYVTKYGPVDIVAIDSENTYHIIEVKRTAISISAITQLRRYMETFTDSKGYVAAPTIKPSAHTYALKHNITYIPITHD